MLCRACGSEMAGVENCPACNEPILWRCNSCEKENDRSVHTYHPPKQESSKAASVVGTLVSLASGLCMVVPL